MLESKQDRSIQNPTIASFPVLSVYSTMFTTQVRGKLVS